MADRTVMLLRNSILGAMVEIKETDTAFSILVREINNFIRTRVTLLGQYTGTLPNGNPDPATGGPYKWRVTKSEISASAIQSSIAGISEHELALTKLRDAFIEQVVSSGNVEFNQSPIGINLTTSIPNKIIALPLNISMGKAGTQEDAMYNLSESIVTAIRSCQYISSIPTTSRGGMGNTAFLRLVVK